MYEHGGPARRDTHEALRAVPAPQTGGDGPHRHGPREQAAQVSSQGGRWGGPLRLPRMTESLPHHDVEPPATINASAFHAALRGLCPYPTQGVQVEGRT